MQESRSEIEGMDYEAYGREMLRYYNGTDNPVHQIPIAQHLAGLRDNFQTEGNAFREVALAMQEALRGRQVLEVACGHGRWSLFVAETARKVVATDVSPNLLAIARQIATQAEIPPQKMEFLVADAFCLDAVASEIFDGALVMNFLQHVPQVRYGEFFEGLHSKLEPGAVVFIGANQLTEASKARLYSRSGSSDLYERRMRPDGSVYEIIDNVFDEETLRTLIGAKASHLKITMGAHWWWLYYVVA